MAAVAMSTISAKAPRPVAARLVAAISQQPGVAASPAFIQRMAYHEAVHDHFTKPRNVGSMEKGDENVGTAVVGKAACGDVIKLQVRVDDQGSVSDAKFKTFGCGSAIASSSLATEMIIGKPVDEASGIKNTDIASHLKLPPVKIHCSVLAEEAIQAALADYKKKRASKEEQASNE